MSSFSESKLNNDSLSTFDGEVFHMIGASLYKQEKTVNVIESDDCEIKQETISTKKGVVMLNSQYVIFIVLVIASLTANVYQSFLYHNQINQSKTLEGILMENSAVHSLEIKLWQQKYQNLMHDKELSEFKLNMYQQERNNSLIFDSCWLKAHFGDCAMDLYDTASKDLQSVAYDFNSLSSDINSVSSEVYSMTQSISSAVVDTLSSVTNELYKSATMLEEDINTAVKSWSCQAKDASDYVVESVSEELKVFEESYMEFM